MKKFNLKKPLSLYEDFAASDVSNPNQSVSPAGKTKTSSITVDKVVATPTETPEVSATITSGDKVRAEIVQDVDAILTNLEALSKSITESINLEYDEFVKELTETVLNEAEDGFLAKIMKSIASAKAYSTVMGTYPGMMKNLLKAEINKTKKLTELKIKGDEFQADSMEKLSAKSKADIAAAPNLAAKQKLRAKRDALKDKAKAQGDVQLKTATSKLTQKLDNVIRDIKAKITKVEKDNPIESEDLKLKWAEQKLGIDDKIAMEKIEKNGAIELEYADGGDKGDEVKERIQERINKQAKRQAEETEKLKAGISDDLNAYKNKEAKAGENDGEDVKEAKTKIRAFIDAHSAYLANLQGTDFELLKKEKPTDEEKAEIKAQKKDKIESRKKYNELKNGLSATTFATAEGTDKESGEETFDAFKKMTEEQLEKFESELDAISTDQDLDDDKKAKSAEDVAKEKLGDNFKDYTKITDPEEKEEDTTDAEGNTVPGKKMWTDVQTFKGLDKEGKETEEEVIYAKKNENQSAATVDGTDINEGVHAKIKKAMKAVEDGETVYGENVRFPGRFKIVSFNKDGSMANVDYEDGTEAFDMAAMNIAIDKLQFESVEIEEAKEELPKKIKLYEGMSVADKFKALM